MYQIPVPKFIKHTLLDLRRHRKQYNNDGFNTLLIALDGSWRQKTNKETLDLNWPLDQMDLSKHLHNILPNNMQNIHYSAEYTFFSSANGTFSKTGHTSGHKTNLNTF